MGSIMIRILSLHWVYSAIWYATLGILLLVESSKQPLFATVVDSLGYPFRLGGLKHVTTPGEPVYRFFGMILMALSSSHVHMGVQKLTDVSLSFWANSVITRLCCTFVLIVFAQVDAAPSAFFTIAFFSWLTAYITVMALTSGAHSRNVGEKEDLPWWANQHQTSNEIDKQKLRAEACQPSGDLGDEMLRNMKLQWLLNDLMEHEKDVGLGMYNRKNLLWRWVSSTALTGVFSYLVVLNRDVEWSALEICAIAYAVTTMTFFFMCMLQIDDIKLGLLVATLHNTSEVILSSIAFCCAIKIAENRSIRSLDEAQGGFGVLVIGAIYKGVLSLLSQGIHQLMPKQHRKTLVWFLSIVNHYFTLLMVVSAGVISHISYGLGADIRYRDVQRLWILVLAWVLHLSYEILTVLPIDKQLLKIGLQTNDLAGILYGLQCCCLGWFVFK
eukprot:m.134163 g.134163  ORF g.134163 m.134163 type:complete len:442 (-) comp14689_c0_seq6:3548-4873(-)